MSSLPIAIKLLLGLVGIVFIPAAAFSIVEYREETVHLEFWFVSFLLPFSIFYVAVGMAEAQHSWHWTTWLVIGLMFNVLAAFLVGVWLTLLAAREIVDRNQVEQIEGRDI